MKCIILCLGAEKVEAHISHQLHEVPLPSSASS